MVIKQVFLTRKRPLPWQRVPSEVVNPPKPWTVTEVDNGILVDGSACKGETFLFTWGFIELVEYGPDESAAPGSAASGSGKHAR